MMLPTDGAYVATKGAVEQLSHVLAKELGPRGITVWPTGPSAFGAAWGISTMTDQIIGDVQRTYDRVAAEHARRVFGELEHNPGGQNR